MNHNKKNHAACNDDDCVVQLFGLAIIFVFVVVVDNVDVDDDEVVVVVGVVVG